MVAKNVPGAPFLPDDPRRPFLTAEGAENGLRRFDKTPRNDTVATPLLAMARPTTRLMHCVTGDFFLDLYDLTYTKQKVE